MTARWLRRRFGRRLARVPFGRRTSPALRALVRAPLALLELDAAGVRLDPDMALKVVALMIDPAWTAGERFTIGHETGPGGAGRCYLQVRDGAPAVVATAPPRGPVSTTIVCPPAALLRVLTGDRASATAIRGNEPVLTRVQQWIERAEFGRQPK
jgi:hypothetical protein